MYCLFIEVASCVNGLGLVFFFFNETATTELYTYGHTRPLHDALPSLLFVHRATGRFIERPVARALCSVLDAHRPNVRFMEMLDADFLLGRQNRTRSEEHTSELQSLLRISYAVFCL